MEGKESRAHFGLKKNLDLTFKNVLVIISPFKSKKKIKSIPP